MMGESCTQTLALHSPTVQSVLATHVESTSHGGQSPPPQSASVSRPFVRPSVHVALVGDTVGDKAIGAGLEMSEDLEQRRRKEHWCTFSNDRTNGPDNGVKVVGGRVLTMESGPLLG